MTLESFISKLNQNLELAKSNLKAQLYSKVNYLTKNLTKYSPSEIEGELQNLVDDFLAQFANIYQEFIMYVEEEIPNLPKTKPKSIRKKKKSVKSEKKKEAFVRPTYVHRAFNAEGLRISKEARPKIMEILNKQIKADIEAIKSQIPTFTRGERKGEKKRITIMPEDVSEEVLIKPVQKYKGQELDSIQLEKCNGESYELVLLLKRQN
ncbi:MAG: hypothetical protein ACTSRS_00005 [Candidatus Helarchaeota archaeon]